MSIFAGQIGYALCPQVARGGMLGHNQPIILQLLDIPPAQESLEGVKMELVDAAFPLLKGKIQHVLVIDILIMIPTAYMALCVGCLQAQLTQLTERFILA